MPRTGGGVLKWPIALITVLSCWSIFCPCGSATTFVIVKAGNAIVVGADCRSTVVRDYTKRAPGPDVCKIVKCAPDMYFVMAAQPLIDVKTGVDFGRIARATCSSGGSPIERANKFERRAVRAAETVYLKDGQDCAVSVVYFGNTQLGSYFFVRSVVHTSKEARTEPRNCPSDCNEWVTGGYNKVMNSLASQGFFEKHGLVDGVRQLVTQEIRADQTNEIGYPISVLKLDGPIETWIEVGACNSAKNGEN